PGRMAGRNLPQSVRRGSERSRHRRADCHTLRAQQGCGGKIKKHEQKQRQRSNVEMGAMVLPTEITHKQAALCLPMLVQGIPAQNGGAVEVDAGSLEEFDSSVLAVLIE